MCFNQSDMARTMWGSPRPRGYFGRSAVRSNEAIDCFHLAAAGRGLRLARVVLRNEMVAAVRAAVARLLHLLSHRKPIRETRSAHLEADVFYQFSSYDS